MKKYSTIFSVFFALFAAIPSTHAQTAIGGSEPHGSAILDVQSDSKGVLFPRMTTTERNAITSPATGLMIFNTETVCLEINLGAPLTPVWQAIKCVGTISALNCNGAVVTGDLIEQAPATGVIVSVPYTGGNGEVHQGQTVTSTGVTGLTATLSGGSFASGSGNLSYSITGTPAGTGTASFALSIGGQSCTVNVNVSAASITTLNCVSAIRKGEMQPNFQADGVSVIVPYTGGNGGGYIGQTVNSTGVTGYTATLAAGNFVSGDGMLTYTITGTSSTSGTATFALNIGGQTCNLDLSVRSCSAKVNATDTKIFHCYNLGAYNTRADAFTPSYEIIGNYYQWGRNPDCFGTDGTDAPNPCPSPVYGAAGPWGSTENEDNAGAITGWNTINAANTDWTDTPTAKGPHDPCPQGFRVPAAFQWDGVILNNGTPVDVVNPGGSWSDSSTNYDTGRMFGNDLFLPALGRRGSSTGSLFFRGSGGRYWTSTRSATTRAFLLDFDIGGTGSNFLLRTNAFAVRCIAED
jgi:uncharacterized protein (TIGR02145 family)